MSEGRTQRIYCPAYINCPFKKDSDWTHSSSTCQAGICPTTGKCAASQECLCTWVQAALRDGVNVGLTYKNSFVTELVVRSISSSLASFQVSCCSWSRCGGWGEPQTWGADLAHGSRLRRGELVQVREKISGKKPAHFARRWQFHLIF